MLNICKPAVLIGCQLGIILCLEFTDTSNLKLPIKSTVLQYLAAVSIVKSLIEDCNLSQLTSMQMEVMEPRETCAFSGRGGLMVG